MRTKDDRLVRLAERQHTVFARAQARALGLTPDEIDTGVASGTWERLTAGPTACAARC